jgi:hypothetical protein
LLEWQVGNAVLDALLSAGSPRLEDLTDTLVRQLVAEYDKMAGPRSPRRGLIKLSRVFAGKGITPAPLHNNEDRAGPRSDMLSTVPPEWAEWASSARRVACFWWRPSASPCWIRPHRPLRRIEASARQFAAARQQPSTSKSRALYVTGNCRRWACPPPDWTSSQGRPRAVPTFTTESIDG